MSMALLEDLLAEQQDLTAVERFAQWHDRGTGVSPVIPAETCRFPHAPAQAKYYSALIPARTPQAGEQFAFEVELDACSGCKACVSACHALNGLDDQETWRDVGLLIGGTTELPVLQHVTAACHHCLDPACMNVCPVDAYEKDPLTGIVLHLDDQCFGCQYCTLACPYDVPKYNVERGIVRKCDMCSQRLVIGEAPACVQACPNQAIRIAIVRASDVVADSEGHHFVPGAPDPQFTLPTTQYKTSRSLPRNLLPSDYYSVRPEHTHWPLVVMLVLTQFSVGAFLTGYSLQFWLEPEVLATLRPMHSLNALIFGLVALAASTLHLGRPHLAFRAIRGLRHSWLSREILAFGLFAGAAVTYAAACWFSSRHSPRDETLITVAASNVVQAVSRDPSDITRSVMATLSAPPSSLLDSLNFAVLFFGLLGVFCSVRIYQVTQRPFWTGVWTLGKFGLTTLLLGVAGVWLTIMLQILSTDTNNASHQVARYGGVLCPALMAIAATKLLFEASILGHLWDKQQTPLRRSARLLVGPLVNVTMARFGLGFLGGLWMPVFLWMGESLRSGSSPIFVTIVVAALFVACLVGEILERSLFFAAVVAPKMGN